MTYPEEQIEEGQGHRVSDSRLEEMILWAASGLMNHKQNPQVRKLQLERLSVLLELKKLRASVAAG